jgi:hypothetical protein
MALAITLITPVCDAIHQLEGDQPLLSWLLPTWVNIVRFVRSFEEQHERNALLAGQTVSLVDIVKKRFDIHYSECWAAAHLVDPMFAQQGASGWYLVKGREDMLKPAKLADALKCLKQLAGPGNAAAVQAEFTKLKLVALPEAMAADLPVLTQRREVDGKVMVASAEMRRGFWDVHSAHFPHISAAAVKLLSFHITSCASERNWSVWGRLCTKTTNRRVLERAEKLVAIMVGSDAAAASDAEAELIALLAEA